MISTLASGFQRVPNPEDAARDRETYTIYSLIMTHPPSSAPGATNERFLIADTTLPGHLKEDCVNPTKDREAEFLEVLVDLSLRKATPRHLRRTLAINKPYELLTAAEVSDFVDERASRSSSSKSRHERYRGVTDLFTLGDVYFNNHRTLALTSITAWCSNVCAWHEWLVFEKADSGGWQQLPWETCVTISSQELADRNIICDLRFIHR